MWAVHHICNDVCCSAEATYALVNDVLTTGRLPWRAMPRSWIIMQIAIAVLLLISVAIACVKLWA